MEAFLKDLDLNELHAGSKGASIQMNTSFTEIFDLIFHNKTMVRSELAVLIQLIQNKYNKLEASSKTPSSVNDNAHKACDRQASAGKKDIERRELGKKITFQKNFFSNCCVCKKIRIDDNGSAKGRWMEVEHFLKEEMDILLSSTYCPKCAQTVQEDLMAQLDR